MTVWACALSDEIIRKNEKAILIKVRIVVTFGGVVTLEKIVIGTRHPDGSWRGGAGGLPCSVSWFWYGYKSVHLIMIQPTICLLCAGSCYFTIKTLRRLSHACNVSV